MMAIGIYTSRVVLQALGVENYGIYGLVGTFVAMFAFVNGVLAAGTSRFITFELGKNDSEAVKKIFNAAFAMHSCMAIVVFVVLETVGLWFLNNKLNIPAGREFAANCVFQFSLLTCCVSLTQVPYSAMIVANERFDLYAYVGIAEAVFKCIVPLTLVYLHLGDVLIVYAAMLALWTFSMQIFYRVYCLRHFPETRLCIIRDKSVYKSMLSYSLWDFLGQICATVNIQGLTVLVNMFFGVSLNAAQGVANEVQGHIQVFIGNFTTSVNPQIVKSYAKQDYGRFFQLINEAGKYSYFLFLFLALPVFLECDYILSVWLTEVPEHTTTILRCIMVIALFRTPANPVIRGVHATGDVKFLNLTSGMQAVLLPLPGTYICFKLGCPCWSCPILYALTQFLGSVFEVVSLYRSIKFNIWGYVGNVYVRTFCVTILSSALPSLCVYYMDQGFIRFLATGVTCVVSAGLSIWFIGLTKSMRAQLLGVVRNKLKR